MNRKDIEAMFKEAPVIKEPRVVDCIGCGKKVKIGKYCVTAAYRCYECRYPGKKTDKEKGRQ